MAVALPIERVVDDHAPRRTDDAVVGGHELTGQRPRVGIDQPRLLVKAVATLRGVRPVSLEMVERAGFEFRDEEAPDVAPAIG
jgi:hypothetical protein